MRVMFRLVTLVALAMFSASPRAAALSGPMVAGPAEVLGAVQWDMSTADGRAYRIFVLPPAGGARFDEYPVLFVLDGNVQFATAASQALTRTTYGETRPAYIVGIGYPFTTVADYLRVPRPRNRDLTPWPPAEPEADGNIHGGAEAFFRFIDRELRPELKRRFPGASNSDQWLLGHSLAGLFTLHTVMTRPHAFRGYVAASPSLWFNPEAQAAVEAGFAENIRKGSSFPPLLLMVGDKEPVDQAVAALASRLGALHGASAGLVFQRLPDETHVSVVPSAISRAVGFALGRSR